MAQISIVQDYHSLPSFLAKHSQRPLNNKQTKHTHIKNPKTKLINQKTTSNKNHPNPHKQPTKQRSWNYLQFWGVQHLVWVRLRRFCEQPTLLWEKMTQKDCSTLFGHRVPELWWLHIIYQYISCFSIQPTHDFSVIPYHKYLLTLIHTQAAWLARRSSHLLYLLPLWIVICFSSRYSTSCPIIQLLTEGLVWERKGRKIQPTAICLWTSIFHCSH